MSSAPQDGKTNESQGPAAGSTPAAPSSPFQAGGNKGFTGAGFQSGSAPRVPGGNYTANPSYSGTSYAGSDAGRRLVVGQGITLSGEIESCDHLIVEGTVEAALKGAAMLDIAESGMFYGTVEIGEAVIAGRFEGDLTVNGRLTIRASGSITGAISYKELAIEAGATVDGTLTPLNAKPAAARSPRKDSASAAKKSENTSASKKADEGSELPFAEKTTVAAE